MKTGVVVNKKLQSTVKSKLNEDLGYSQFNAENNKSVMLAQTIGPKKGHQVDDYVGPVDPATRLRHGQGTYRYPNKFFTFEGNYHQGVKEGRGTLKLGDGTVINGMFVNNQLTGQAQIYYPDGSTYKGSLRNGQKSGFGAFKSKLQQYEGQYLENKRHGTGRYQNSTTTIVGQFQNNKPSGDNVEIRKYNYEYKGSCVNGFKSGKGVEISTYLDENYRYEGQFQQDKFEGKGEYINNSNIGYKYEGDFKGGLPALYPNEFKVLLATTTGIEAQQPTPQTYTCITTDQNLSTPIEYELQSENQLHFLIQSCYQGPEQLDPNQPTEEEIDKMTKDWQNQNKKNKNPPPMPDFRQPRKIKPALLLVEQESARPIELRLTRGQGNQNSQYLKIDYRESIKKKRAENEILKAEAAKKAEEEGNKKGGKGGAKAEVELKVNTFVTNPDQKQKTLQVINEKGKAGISRIQFPDDFPPGTYQLVISSPFKLFGAIKQVKKTINIKAKNTGGKKK